MEKVIFLREVKIMKKCFTFIICCLGGLVFNVNALDDVFRNRLNPPTSSEETPKIKKLEKELDQGIQALNKTIAYYKKLNKFKIKYTPGRTIFRKNDKENYIEIESYSFIPESYIFKNLVGMRSKIMRLYYGQGNQASRIETKFYDHNFLTHKKNQSSIIDPSPMTNDMSDVLITDQLGRSPQYKSTLGKIENSIAKPMRTAFKKDYLQHLANFERLLKFTEDLQIEYGSHVDRKVIKSMKRSLRY